MSISRSNKISKPTVPSRQNAAFLNIVSLTGVAQSIYAWNSAWQNLYAHIDITNPNDNVPSGFTTVSSTPTGVAGRWLDYQEYLGHRKGCSNLEGGDRWGVLSLKNWGMGSTGLLWHTADAVSEALDGVQGPFCANGISGWKSWTETFVSGVLAQTVSRTGIYNNGVALPHMAICQCTQRNASGVMNWWGAVATDPRYGTEIVAKVNGTGFTVSGLYSRYISEGGSVPNTSLASDNSANRVFSNWWYEVAELIRDYAITEAFYKPLISGFGVLQYGVIDSRLPASSGLTYYDLYTSGIRHTNRYNNNPFANTNVILFQNTISGTYPGTQNQIWNTINLQNITACASGSNKTTIVYVDTVSGFVAGSPFVMSGNNYTSGVHYAARFGVRTLMSEQNISQAASGTNIMISSTGVNTGGLSGF